jgi:glycosyltransferase involved in cell wall biosynthesis
MLESAPRPVRRLLRRLPGMARLRRALAGTPRGPASMPGALRPVVYLPTWERWDEMRQRPQYITAALAAAGHDAYFVDPRETVPRQAEGVHVVPSLRFVPRSHPILYVHYAPLRELFDRFHEPVVVYDVLDDLSIYEPDEQGLPEHRRVRAHHGPVLESAGVAITSSPVLLERHRSQRPDLLLVENGVDVDRFAERRARPHDLPTGRPVVGYHGAIARWFDFDLLRSVAAANPRWDFVLVGPVLPDVAGRAEALSEQSNVHLLGARPSADIAAYIQAFDAGVIWFVVDHLTEGVSPLKMFEYLAADVPVVATPLPSCRGMAGVRVASTVEEMTAAITDALESGSEETQVRRSAAEAASWEARVAPVLRRLDDLGLRTVPP